MLSACTVKLADGPGGSTSGDDTDPTAGQSSAPTGDGPDTATGAAPTGEPSTTNDSVVIPETTTGVEENSSTADLTTGDTEGSGSTACALMCEHAAECGLADDAGACTLLCEGNLAESAPACAAATTTATLCFAGLGCEDLAEAFSGGSAHVCDPEQNDREAACGADGDCDFGAGGDFEGSMCELEIFCAGDPVQKMTCDTEQCLCLEDGEQVGSCPAEAICDTLAEISDKGVSCCGFPPVDL